MAKLLKHFGLGARKGGGGAPNSPKSDYGSGDGAPIDPTAAVAAGQDDSSTLGLSDIGGSEHDSSSGTSSTMSSLATTSDEFPPPPTPWLRSLEASAAAAATTGAVPQQQAFGGARPKDPQAIHMVNGNFSRYSRETDSSLDVRDDDDETR